MLPGSYPLLESIRSRDAVAFSPFVRDGSAITLPVIAHLPFCSRRTFHASPIEIEIGIFRRSASATIRCQREADNPPQPFHDRAFSPVCVLTHLPHDFVPPLSVFDRRQSDRTTSSLPQSQRQFQSVRRCFVAWPANDRTVSLPHFWDMISLRYLVLLQVSIAPCYTCAELVYTGWRNNLGNRVVPLPCAAHGR